ncbi:MAG TPA: OsmC family protein [Mycobacteriales bacterium]|nr:OsmC family protein [Mycobacteriales bacterium]
MKLAHVTATSSPGDGYPVEIAAGHHHLTADEPESNGGTDTGASPYGLLLSGLAACTLITLRMYAQRKEWAVSQLRVAIDMTDDEGNQHIERRLHIDGALDDEQRSRLLDIAERTPVTKTLKRGVEITTHLAD